MRLGHSPGVTRWISLLEVEPIPLHLPEAFFKSCQETFRIGPVLDAFERGQEAEDPSSRDGFVFVCLSNLIDEF